MIKQIFFWQPNNYDFGPLVFFFSHWFLWLLVIGLSVYWLAVKKYKRMGWFWLILGLSEAIQRGLKLFSGWERPFYSRSALPPEWLTGYSVGSFPSGHAFRSVIILYFLWQVDKKLFWLALPGVVMVSIGRVLFGLHYPIDIIGGLALGLILVKLVKLRFKI